MAKNHIGTSGWSYEHWDKVFYSHLPSNQRLQFYAKHFQTVEINTTFYHLPKPQVVKNWHKTTPKNFLFSIKASSYITHLKRLKDPEESLKKFFTSIKNLKEKTGPILFQLSPSFKRDDERLKNFIKKLPKKKRYTFEFRHESWFAEEVYQILQKNKMALCITDLAGKLSPIELTSNFVYIRLHGPKRAYQGSYSDRKLKEWAKKIKEWNEKKIKVFLYFDNDQKGYALADAKRLKELL